MALAACWSRFDVEPADEIKAMRRVLERQIAETTTISVPNSKDYKIGDGNERNAKLHFDPRNNISPSPAGDLQPIDTVGDVARNVATQAPIATPDAIPSATMVALAEGSRRAFVFVGEAGAGKSEIAVNLALALARDGRPVRFFDLDQTKPMFRSRDMAAAMRATGVEFAHDHQKLDARTIPCGIFDGLCDPSRTVVLDVGGDAQGATMLGQFAGVWGPDAAAFLVINPFRVFFDHDGGERLIAAADAIRRAARPPLMHVIANPNLGADTHAADVVAGYRQVERMLSGSDYVIEAVGALSSLCGEVAAALPGMKILPIKRYIVPVWETDEVRRGEIR
jgi:hypothetical protein